MGDEGTGKLVKYKKIEVIQVIRAVAAVGILIYHTHMVGERLYFGVDIFNVISGYLMMLTTVEPKSRNMFVRKRLVRVFPLYWLVTLFSFCVLYQIPSLSPYTIAKPEYLIKSMFFIPFINDYGYNWPLVSVGWTLNYEVFFTLIFALAMRISHKYRGLWAVFITVAYIVLGRCISLPYELSYYSSIFILEFIWGIIAYYLVQLIKDMHNIYISRVCSILMVVSYLIMLANIGNAHRVWSLGIPAFVLLTSSLVAYGDAKMPNALVNIGDCSYSFYFVEYITTAVFKIFCVDMSLYVKIIGVIITVAITYLLSRVSYDIIEKRFTKIILNKIYSKGTL